MKNPEKSFQWIVNILQKHNVPFVVTGGLAAKSYGSPRPLNDIDIDIHDNDFAKIIDDIRPYLTFGPAVLVDERWDTMLATLNYEGQDIDLSGGDTLKICDARTGEWKLNKTDFSNVEHKDIFGITVPVAIREDLIAYKSMLEGDHQLVDIQAMKDSIK